MTHIATGEYEEYLAKQTLAFTPIKQSAFIGFLFDGTNGLFKHYATIMDASWFTLPEHQNIFSLIKEYVQKYDSIPTHISIQESNVLLKKEASVVTKIRTAIDKSIIDKNQFVVQQLIDELEDWKNAKIFQKAITESTHTYNKGKFDEVNNTFKAAIKAVNETTFVRSEVKLASNIKEITDHLDGSATIPFGLKLIDNHLFDGNENGGLQLGDQTLLMGSSNGGKTTTILTCCIHNVRAQNHSMLMTHEGTHQDIRQKYIRCYLTLMDIPEAQKVMGVDEVKAKAYVELCRQAGSSKRLFSKLLQENSTQLMEFLNHIDKYLTYLPYHRAGMEVEKIIPIIERYQDGLKDKIGTGYKLLAVDYPALLNTEQASKGRMDVRHKIDYIYQQYVQMALEHGWHSLVASQSNREGSKVNSRTDGQTRLLGMEDNAEAWGPITTATNVFTINRSPEAQQKSRILFRNVKSRSSSTGVVVSATCDFGKCVSHSNDPRFGALSYYGNTEHAALLDMHMVPGVQRALTEAEQLGGDFGT